MKHTKKKTYNVGGKLAKAAKKAKEKTKSTGTPKKSNERKSSSIEKQTVKYSKGSDGSTVTQYPKTTSSRGIEKQLTKTTKPIKKAFKKGGKVKYSYGGKKKAK